MLLKSSRADQRGFVAKLSDFGLSRVLHTAATSRAMHGPHASHASHASQRGAMRTLSMASGTGGMTPLGPRSGRQAPGDSYGPGDGFASGGGVEDSGLLYGGAVYGGLMYGGAGSAASAGLGAGGWQAGDGEPKLVGALDGTVPFLAPELIEEGQRSKASDVWAYGEAGVRGGSDLGPGVAGRPLRGGKVGASKAASLHRLTMPRRAAQLQGKARRGCSCIFSFFVLQLPI